MQVVRLQKLLAPTAQNSGRAKKSHQRLQTTSKEPLTAGVVARSNASMDSSYNIQQPCAAADC